MFNISLCLEENGLKVSSNIEAPIKWINNTLLPYIKIGCADNIVMRIECIYNKTEKPSGTFLGEESLFLEKKGKKFETNDGIEMLNENGTLYRLTGDKLTIFYPELCEESMREPSRFCREILYNSLQLGTWTEIHAAAIECNGNAIAFIGDKGAGKSTIVSHFLSNWNNETKVRFNFITNDRLWIKVDDDNNLVMGSPMPVLLGYGTMMTIPELRNKLSLFRDGFYTINNKFSEKKNEFSTQEYAELFGICIARSANLKAIIFLTQGEDCLPVPVKREDRLELFSKLARDTAHSTYPNWLNKGSSVYERETYTPKNVPMFTMCVNVEKEYLLKAKANIINTFSDLFFAGDIGIQNNTV